MLVPKVAASNGWYAGTLAKGTDNYTHMPVRSIKVELLYAGKYGMELALVIIITRCNLANSLTVHYRSQYHDLLHSDDEYLSSIDMQN